MPKSDSAKNREQVKKEKPKLKYSTEIDPSKTKGDKIGRMYNGSDSPIAEVYMSKKGEFFLVSNTTGKAISCPNVRKLICNDYLVATGGEKMVYVRWVRNKKFDIRKHASVWHDKKPHWSAQQETKLETNTKKK